MTEAAATTKAVAAAVATVAEAADESFAAVLVHAVELIAYFKVFSVFYLHIGCNMF